MCLTNTSSAATGAISSFLLEFSLLSHSIFISVFVIRHLSTYGCSLLGRLHFITIKHYFYETQAVPIEIGRFR